MQIDEVPRDVLEFSVVWVASLVLRWLPAPKTSGPGWPGAMVARGLEHGQPSYLAVDEMALRLKQWSRHFEWVHGPEHERAVWFEDPADAAAWALQLDGQFDVVRVERLRPADTFLTRTHVPIVWAAQSEAGPDRRSPMSCTSPMRPR